MMRILASILAVLLLVPLGAIAAQTHSTDLDGTNQFWSIADASQSGLDIAGDFTFCAFVKRGTSNTDDMILSKADVNAGNSGRSFWFAIDDSGATTINVYITDGSGAKSGAWTQDVTAGTWFPICALYTASAGSVEVYFNNSSLGSVIGFPTSINNTSAPFYVGALHHATVNPQHPMDGQIDDVRVWTRVLTAGEIDDYSTDTCNFVNGASIVSVWGFDNTGNDSVGSNNLTNNNTATFTTDTAYAACASAVDGSYLIIFE